MLLAEMLTSIENTAFGIWVRESGSIWSYPMIITMHAYGMAMLAGLSAVIDLRILGFGSGVPLVSMKKIVPLIKAGFWVSLLSGIALTIGDAATMLISPVFYIKMAFIVFALVTGMLINRRVLGHPAPASGAWTRANTLAVCSLVFWMVAITAGRLTAYLGPSVALKGVTH